MTMFRAVLDLVTVLLSSKETSLGSSQVVSLAKADSRSAHINKEILKVNESFKLLDGVSDKTKMILAD